MNVQVKKYCGKCQKHKPVDAFADGSRICAICVQNRKAALNNLKQGVSKQVGKRSF